MRIGVLFEYPTLSGGERSLLAVADRLRSAGVEFTMLAPDAGPLAEAIHAQGLPLHAFTLRDEAGKRLDPETLAEHLRSAITEHRLDLLHANSLAMGRHLGRCAAALPVPTTAHLRDILKLTNAAIADLNRNSHLVTVSHATREHHLAQGLDPARCTVIHNGVDSEKFQPRPPTGFLHRELGLPPDALLIGTIGQICLRKGHDILAAAFTGPLKSHPHLHWVIIGERFSGKAESIDFDQRLTDEFARASISHRLHRLGYRDDIPRLMNELDLLVHPAHQEPLGRVLLEAAASGLPIIATHVGGTAEIVENDKSARLVFPDDPATLAAAISELADDPARRAELATNARSRMLAHFTIDQAADQLRSTWHHVLRSPT